MSIVNSITTLALLLACGTCMADDKLFGTVIGTEECVDYATSRKTTTVNTRDNAFDGNLNTFFASWERNYTWVGLDLHEPHVITRVAWAPRNDGSNGERRVQLAVFEGANSPDFADALPLYIVPQTGTLMQMSYADVHCSRGFRYVRYVGPADARCNVAEVEFYGHPGEGDDSALYQLTNLPTVSIHTANGEIPYDKVHLINAQITIISDQSANLLSEPGNIRERGNASRSFPKKPYRIKFDHKQHVIDAPAKAKKWTLINNYGDKTLMRNLVAFEISRRFSMPYTPYGRAVDVILNGEYKGCYQLCDQVEVRKKRVDVIEMTPDDNFSPNISGGYLIEVDAYAGEEQSAFWSQKGTPVTIKSPDEDSITLQQRSYITNQFNIMERSWKKRLDMNTFLQYILVEELIGNIDSFWSVFLYKQRGDDLFYTGPVWDCDLAFDNDQRVYPVSTLYSDFSYLHGSHAGNFYQVATAALNDAEVHAQLLDIWDEARHNGINEEELTAYTEKLQQELQASQQLNFIRWPIMKQYVHENPKIWGSFDAEVNHVKRFIKERLQWMDRYLNYVYIPSSDIPALQTVDYNQPYRVFSIDGRFCGNSLNGLFPGIYIVRQGTVSKKIVVD